MNKLLLLLRVSNPEYNKTLYLDNSLYMNRQSRFYQDDLTEGQIDKNENLISTIPSQLYYSKDRKKWEHLIDLNSIYGRKDIYIYCMYGVDFDFQNYDKGTNSFYYLVPWEYIKKFYKVGEHLELMVIKTPSVLIDKFVDASNKQGLSYAYDRICYDLDEKKKEIGFIKSAINDPFVPVFHKIKDDHEIQNEVRFAVICPNGDEHINIEIDNKLPNVLFDLIPIKPERDILIHLTDIIIDSATNQPLSFSSKIEYIYHSIV